MDGPWFFIGIAALILIFGVYTQGGSIRERIGSVDLSAHATSSIATTDAARRASLQNELSRLRTRENAIKDELGTTTIP